jgi:type II secretory pathway predicted ATPase ExeA
MYEGFFQIAQRPFSAVPRTASYVPVAPLEEARRALVRCVERAEGIGLAIGPAGTGKTLLCQLIAEHFRSAKYQVAVLASARLHTRRALLQNILFELNLPYRGMEDEELRLSLVDHLQPRSGESLPLVLVVDEAHTLPLRLLEEIRVISNEIRDGQMPVRLILAGGSALEERLANPKLESLTQRIAARHYLTALSQEETRHYIREQLRRAGADAERIASDEVLHAVHRATDGIPRLINQLCDHALLLALASGERSLSVGLIEEAWSDLQRLPAPWHTEAAAAPQAAGGAIEFGPLADGSEQPDATRAGADPLGTAALASLDRIDSTVQALESEGEQDAANPGSPAEDFSPLAGSTTEVELAFHTAHDPFGGEFDEEEVIIDRYASLEARASPNRSRVESLEGRILGEALRAKERSPEDAAGAPAPPAAPTADQPQVLLMPAPEESPQRAADAAEGFNPANDPVLPEAAASERREALPSPPAPRPMPLAEVPSDDRDLIVVQNAAVQPQPASIGSSTKREYRQLFRTLRKG